MPSHGGIHTHTQSRFSYWHKCPPHGAYTHIHAHIHRVGFHIGRGEMPSTWGQHTHRVGFILAGEKCPPHGGKKSRFHIGRGKTHI